MAKGKRFEERIDAGGVLAWLGWRVTDIERLDLGAIMNAETGLRWFQRGELMQYSCRVNGLRMWVAHNTRLDNFRVAFGERPIELMEVNYVR